jgi:hypothetical protein
MAFFIYALNISDIEAELSVHKMAGAISSVIISVL